MVLLHTVHHFCLTSRSDPAFFYSAGVLLFPWDFDRQGSMPLRQLRQILELGSDYAVVSVMKLRPSNARRSYQSFSAPESPGRNLPCFCSSSSCKYEIAAALRVYPPSIRSTSVQSDTDFTDNRCYPNGRSSGSAAAVFSNQTRHVRETFGSRLTRYSGLSPKMCSSSPYYDNLRSSVKSRWCPP